MGLEVTTVASGVAVLGAAALAHVFLRWLVRRKVGRDRAAAVTGPGPRDERQFWIDRALEQAVSPLALLIWVLAVRAIAATALDEFGVRDSAPLAARAVGLTGAAAFVAALAWLLARVGAVVDSRLALLASRSPNSWDDLLLALAGKAARRLLPLAALVLGAPAFDLSPDLQDAVSSALTVVLIGAVALALYDMVRAVEALILQQYRIDVADNLQARAVHTQVTVLRKVATVVIAVFTAGSMLMVFESVRQFGTSILASAGIAGLVIGFAAQRSIGTLLAGIQLAITQPIRIDDVVIVESEWGRIEDITLTYVTVRIWDQRRLIVPVTYFLEKPFQNWTVASAEIVGTVFLNVDYCVPVEALRAELDRILAASPYWDGKVKVLQVTDAKAHAVELRALASAADASLAWDLRCEIREKLIAFIRAHHPESLPRVRAELQRSGEPVF